MVETDLESYRLEIRLKVAFYFTISVDLAYGVEFLDSHTHKKRSLANIALTYRLYLTFFYFKHQNNVLKYMYVFL